MAIATALISGKGGTGKSTLAVNIAAALARLHRRVALVDASVGLRSLDIMLGVENSAVYDWLDLAGGVCSLKQALCRCGEGGSIALLCAPQLQTPDEVNPEALKDVIATLRDLFDDIIIDSPSGLGSALTPALSAADQALVIAQSDPISLRCADRVAQQARAIGLPVLLAANRVSWKAREADADGLSTQLKLDLAGAVPDLGEAPLASLTAGQPPIFLGRSGEFFDEIAQCLIGMRAPKSPAAEEDDAPLLSLDELLSLSVNH